MGRIGVWVAVVLLGFGTAWAAGSGLGGLDRDRDGSLDRQEVQAGTEEAFRAYDRNGDSALDRAEYEAAGGSPARFMEIDTDKDGRITLKELSEATRKRFEAIDRNRDGRIDVQELKARQAPIENPLFVFHF